MNLDTLLWILLALALVGLARYAFGRRNSEQPVAPQIPSRQDDVMARKKKSAPAPEASATAPAPADGEVSIRSWGYQLQKFNLKRAVQSPFDLLVIDYSKDGSDEKALKPADVAALQRKPDGGRRVVLSYLSIGEAESYRYYWDDAWKTAPPSWLLGENPDWEENYAVCFWDDGWQQKICGSPEAYLDKIIDAGFDGIYLDKCDVFEDMLRSFKAVAKTRRDIAGDMVAFVARLSAYAKQRRPGFLVVMQNAESLLDRPPLVAAIDGIAKEELVFGVDAPEKRNMKDDIDYSSARLAKLRDAGKLVLVVEYLNDQKKIADAAKVAADLGFVLYISEKNRNLDRLNYEVLEA